MPNNFNWHNAILFIKEKDVNNLDNIIRRIPLTLEFKLRNNAIKAYYKFCHKDNFISTILDYYNKL